MLIHPKGKVREPLAALSLVLIVLGIVYIMSDVSKRVDDSTISYTSYAGEEITSSSNTDPLEASRPVRLSIPKLSIDATFVSLGLQTNGEIEIPTSTVDVGWYEYGPTPGELGPAVVLGHVDSREGPGVFFYLGQLEVGDRVEIERADGSTVTFQVDALERYPQSNFPTSLVYGDIDHAGLRIITCSGSYDRALRRYDHNLVVYASLVE